LRPRLAVFAVLLVLAACVYDKGPGDTPVLAGDPPGPTASAQPSPHGGPVLAVGDSLMVGVVEHGHLGAILTLDGWELETVAGLGRSVRWAIDQIESREERVPRSVVVALGTNPGFSSFGFAQEVTELRDALVKLGARHILWMPPHNPDDPERYAEKEQILRDLDRADRRMVVPEWGAILDQHPDWVVGDGIHLTEDGYAAMAVFIRDRL
jgi:lysophospholipase L1-like esterase